MEYYFPIPNESACHECHGSDHAVRGIEYFRISFASTYTAINRSSLFLVVFLVGLAVVSGLLLVGFVRKVIVSPILSLYAQANRLRDGDLTGRIDVKSRDEIGVLSLRFQEFVSSFRGILLKIKTETERTNKVGTFLAASSDRSRRELDNISTHIGEMRTTVSTLDSEVGNSGRSAANQIRSLAETSASSAKEMAESLKNTTDYIRQSEEAAGRTMQILTEIFKQFGEMVEGMQEMRNAHSELDLTAQQILQSLAALKEFTSSVKSSSESMGDRAREIDGSMSALSDVSGRARSGMDEITASIESILEAAREVSATGEKNLEKVKELEKLIGRFKIG